MKKNNFSVYLCEAIFESDEKGIKVINKLEKDNLLNINVIEYLAVCIEPTEESHMNALHVAAANGRVNSLSKLLSVTGVNPNVKDEYEWTPLHLAVFFCGTSSSMDCVKTLVNTKNININIQDKGGYTPLISALYSCEETSSVECIQFLLSLSQIDFNLRNHNDLTAFQFVLYNPSVKELVAKWVIDGLQGRAQCITHLIFPPNLHKWMDYELLKFNKALGNSTKLERLTCDKSSNGNSQWYLIGLGMDNNYSVIGFVDKKTDEDWVLEIMERNRKARSKCFEASVQTFLIFKQKLNKDMGNLFALWVWETRGTKIWSF